MFHAIRDPHERRTLSNNGCAVVVINRITAVAAGTHSLIDKPGWAGDRFGDELCGDYANLPCASRCNQVSNTKFARHIAKISKSTHCSYSYVH